MIYFKIVNHSAKTDNEIFEIKYLQNNTFYGTSRSYLNFNNNDVNLINNVWYSFEDILKKCGLSNNNITDLKYPNYVKGYYDYIDSSNNSNSTYYLGYLDVYEVSSKYDTKGTNVGRWAESSYKNKNNGTYINFKFGDATLNNSKDRYFIVHSGNPLSDPANNPIIKWNGILGKLNIDANKKLYSNIIDTNAITSNTNFNIMFTDNYNLSIYKNGYLLETSNFNKNDSRTYNLSPNDILEFKKATETTPPKPIEPPKPTPVYYNLPSVSHVTFNPNKAELGKMTPIKVTVETGYTINDLTFSADNPNTVTTIFTSSYKDGIINLDLTSFDPTDISSANELITVKQNITKIVHKDWLIPSATDITFTSGGTTISTVKLGEYTNVYLNLDDHYTWSYNQGKGLILNDGTVLGSWNGKNTFGINLEKYLDPEQLQSAHWDLNYTKTDFSDEHKQQIPLKLDLVHCKSDTSSILENSSKTVTLTADAGYIFDDDVIYYYYDDEGSYYDKLTKKANKQNTISFEIAVGSYHDYQQQVSYMNDLPSIKAVATKPDAIPTGTKSIHIYNMSDGEINTTMNSLVQKFGQNGPETVDFTGFINQIYRIPFTIPNDLTENVDEIEVGKYTVDVNTKQVNQDKLIVDGGSITVEPHYKNANDYSPIECVLYLPFTKEVNLNINDIINHAINIKYNIDLLSGETTIIVSNENNEIYTGQFNISTSLEFYGLYEDKVVNRLNSTYINDILQAYVKLIYNKPIENLVSYETMEHGVLKDYHGFTKISNIDLQGTYNYNESTEIKELLKQGVFINGITRN